MQTHRVADNARRNEDRFEILHDEEKEPVTKSGCVQSPHCAAAMRTAGTQHKTMPTYGIIVRKTTSSPMSGAKFNPSTEKSGANKEAVNEADEKLPAEIGDDVVVDLRKDGGHFVLQR